MDIQEGSCYVLVTNHENGAKTLTILAFRLSLAGSGISRDADDAFLAAVLLLKRIRGGFAAGFGMACALMRAVRFLIASLSRYPRFAGALPDRSPDGQTIRTRIINSLLFPVNVHESRDRSAGKPRRYWLKCTSRAARFFEFPVKIPVSRELAPRRTGLSPGVAGLAGCRRFPEQRDGTAVHTSGASGLRRSTAPRKTICRQMSFCPPTPAPRDAPLNLFALLAVLGNNPLKAWTKAHFEQTLVHGGLPFMPAVVLNDPEGIQHVLLDNVANYRKDDLLLRILSPGLDNGLLTVEGEQWRRQRRALAPLFARKTIHGFAPAMTAAADALVARWSRLPDGSTVDIAKDVTLVTLDVLQRTIFSQGIERDTEEFRAAMRRYFDTIGRIDPFDVLGLPQFLPRPTRWRARAALRYFDSAVDAIIAKRRKLLADDRRAVPRDILSLLLDASDPQSGQPLDEAELRANIVTFIAAGHETTANALTWSLYLLSQDDCWRARVAAEADCRPQDEDLDPCGHLIVTRAVIEEALRLYPPIAALSRVAIGADELAGEPLRPGTMVIVAPYVLHRHRRLWDRPEVFDPSRFLGESRERIHRFAYLPFGAGPRICIGAQFALQEASLVLAAIVRNFELHLPPAFEVEPLLRITLRPKGGLPMILRRRIRRLSA